MIPDPASNSWISIPDGLLPGGRFDEWAPARDVRHVALDVDGTLVGRGDDVPPNAVAAIGALLEAGISVGYATGRMHTALDSVDRQLHLPGPHVVHNGAIVRHRGATVASWPLDPEDVRALFEVLHRLDAYAELYDGDGYAVTRMDQRAAPHWELLGQPPTGVVTSAEELDGRALAKATLIAFDEDEVEPMVDALTTAGLVAGPAGSLLTPDLTYVNATRRGVDKGAALREAARVAGTDLAHTVATGDGSNDLPMLAVAGTAIAMGQASEEVRAAAHLVAPAVDEDGLAVALGAVAGLG